MNLEMTDTLQLLLYIALAIAGVFVLRELWRLILWFIHVRLWVRRKYQPPQGRVTMDWSGWRNRPGQKQWDD
jgi:hypothetical protein